MRLLECQALIEFQVLLGMQAAIQVLHAHVVHVHVVSGGHRPHPVEYVFTDGWSRNRSHHHICIGKNAVYCVGHRVGHLLGPLKGHVARQPD